MLFADWLKKYRNIAGLTQKELAQKLDVPAQTISKYENEGVEPRISFAVSVAQILNASLDELSGVQVDKEQKEVEYINSLIKPYYEISKSDAEGEFIIKRIMRRKSDIFPHDMVRLNLPDFCTMSVEKLNDVIKFVNEEKRNAMREAYFTQFDTWFMTQTLLRLTKRLQDVEK